MAHKHYPLLQSVDSPADLRRLDKSQLPQLCQELRDDIVCECSENPGHLASSLGAVELTVALHYVLDTPTDKIVWDVGHQAYGHKILTGRRDVFNTNRKLGGLHPFPTPVESDYDSFVCGHASNSISAALGLDIGMGLQHHVAVVIGDGAMSGGLAFEGMNNVAGTDNNLLIVINDNDMSIDKSVGGLRRMLVSLNTGRGYNRFRDRVSRWMRRRGKLNVVRRGRIIRMGNALKGLLGGGQNLFAGMNIRYFGPFDGHDVESLVDILSRVKDMKGPKLVHLHTVKGKGYKPAEEGGSVWHAPGRYDVASGKRKETSGNGPRFQDVFGATLVELAEHNPRIVGVSAAMLSGTGMQRMVDAFPARTYDVGIAEGHAVTFSAGLAKEGMVPFCAIYSAFAQRAYDNIIHDVCLLHLPVVICMDRAGLVGEDGATHHGMFDMAALRPIPGLTIAAPMDGSELRRMMYTAQLHADGPWVIRYPRGYCGCDNWQCNLEDMPIGTGRCLKEGEHIAVMSIGSTGIDVQKALAMLSEEESLRVAHYDMRFVKPLDTTILTKVLACRHIVTIEDGCRSGGLGSAVTEWLTDNAYKGTITRMGISDHFVEHGTVAELKHLTGLDASAIVEQLKKLLHL